MRVIALLASYNEERFIAPCIEHLLRQEVEVYLIDNSSTDRTVEIAARYRQRGLLGLDTVPRHGVFHWQTILERKDQLARTLEADWFMHVDPDEIFLPPRPGQTLAQAFAEIEQAGYNTVNFQEFTFVPTVEAPDHDHPQFQTTMRWYYPFRPFSPHLLRAWKRQTGCVFLSQSGGHQVSFADQAIFPVRFPMRHYLFLSVPHAIEKYAQKRYDPRAVARGWHGWRAQIVPEVISLPLQRDLRRYLCDEHLDDSNPWTRHHLQRVWEEAQAAAR